jgi:hypothetical protein
MTYPNYAIGVGGIVQFCALDMERFALSSVPDTMSLLVD